MQLRLRKLPARVVVYLLLAAALFEECGYGAVWARLTAALGSLPLPAVTGTGLWHARARLGARPLRALFDLLRGSAAGIRTAGARWAGMLMVAIDGTCLANFAYYEPLTVRDPLLSACIQTLVAAEVDQLELAHDYLAEAALMDLRDVEHNTSDGVHMASLAGAWLAVVAGFGGMRAGVGQLMFSPGFPLAYRSCGSACATGVASCASRSPPSEPGTSCSTGEPVAIVHHGKEFELGKRPSEHDIPNGKAGPRPAQPARRAPAAGP